MTAVLTDIDQRGVGTLTFNRPEVRNAFDAEVMSSVTSFLREHSDLRALVVRGEGKVFSSGADLNWMKSMAGFSEEENIADSNVLLDMLVALDETAYPVIGRVHGAAIAGAVGVVACCDYVVCEDSAWFSIAEVRLGLVPAVISPFVLRKVPYGMARAFFLSGERFSAAEAAMAGLVHRVVGSHELDAAVESVVAGFLKAGPEALRVARELMDEVWGKHPSEVAELTVRTISERRVSEEGQEGVRSFLEKRPPDWAPQGD
jgi:methylglutaconyl-CoA hydratase